jgi:hypothetical protein
MTGTSSTYDAVKLRKQELDIGKKPQKSFSVITFILIWGMRRTLILYRQPQVMYDILYLTNPAS